MMPFEEFSDIKINTKDAKSLRQNIVEVLKEGIYSGYLPPGLKIVESDLARKLNTSRTPIREAIHQLESEGLVTVIPKIGTFVSVYSIDEIEEIYFIFGALQGLAATLSLELITEDQLKQMEACLTKMGDIDKGKDVKEWFIHNKEFHSLYLRPCKKKILLKLIKNYTEQVGRYWYLLLSRPENIELLIKEHWEILEAFRSKNSKMVRENVERHTRSACKIIIESLKLFSPGESSYPNFLYVKR